MTAPEPRAALLALFDAAVRAAQPSHVLPAHLPPPPKGRTVVVGAGKAAAAMVHALEAHWPIDAPLSGCVVTRYGHVPPRPAGVRARVEIREAAHPVPDAAGVAAAEHILSLVQGLSPDDLVLCLISGGGSSLLTLPLDGITLADKQAINQALLHSGAHIGEMNTVRKHLSRIKGGRLAAACAPAPVLTLAISDVPGDDPAVIASGPTVADDGRCSEALEIVERYGIAVPDLVRRAWLAVDPTWETPKADDPRLAKARVQVIATPLQSLQAAADLAASWGVRAHILGDAMEGESVEVGRAHASLALAAAQGHGLFERPCVLLSGGETTVTVKPLPEGEALGRGGRAGEFCLGLAEALQGQAGVWGLAADTDGIDGVEDNAGALVTPDSLARATALGLEVAAHQRRHDAYAYFEALGDLVVTGPTHTNVNDFRAIWIA
jgi:hydroxypyruvate reductase